MTIRICRAAVSRIDIEPLGARIVYCDERTSYADDARIACGGVLFGFFCCVLGCIVFAFAPNEYILLFIAANLALSAVNLLPISFLDGGCALYALVRFRKDEIATAHICRTADIVGRIVLLAVNALLCVASGFNLGLTVLFLIQLARLVLG